MIDKVLIGLKYAATALFYIVSLFALFTWINQMNKDTKELAKRVSNEN